MGSETGDVKAPLNLTDHEITDFDLYLFGEGKHERIYEKLGAHLYASAAASAAGGAAPGTRFAVWAPNAERVSVVGPFNHWNGDAHVMQGRASSGIWELAIPGIGAGTPYKYEIRDRGGRLFVKADPYGFAMQLRPENCSIVTTLDGHVWQDQEWIWLSANACRRIAPAFQRVRSASGLVAPPVGPAHSALHELARGGGSTDSLRHRFGLHPSRIDGGGGAPARSIVGAIRWLDIMRRRRATVLLRISCSSSTAVTRPGSA